jgi:hypothetical protein
VTNPHRVLLGIVAALAATACGSGEESLDVWERADRAIVRLAPSEFPGVPPAIVEALEQRGCRVPQPYTIGGPHNLIHGRFRNAEQEDWAVLCSRDRQTSLLIFWGGSPDEVTEEGPGPDRNSLQNYGAELPGYDRIIATASGEEAILHNLRVYADRGVETARNAPPIMHDGLEFAVAEKGSSIRYLHEGRWYSLPGGD